MSTHTQAEEQRLLEEIKQHADPEYAQVVSKTIPSGLRVYGLRVFEIRQIVRAWKRTHMNITHEDLLKLVEELWKGQFREQRIVALELLQLYPGWIPQLSQAHLERWRQDLDNWELTDVLGVRVLAVWLLADLEERSRYLWHLLADQDVWSRRLALVSTVGLNRAGKGNASADLTLELVERAKEERHPMITKAVSWALRVLGKKHPEQVLTYVAHNREFLAGHVVREVTKKVRSGRNNGNLKKRKSL